jgi:hypothetical protein
VRHAPLAILLALGALAGLPAAVAHAESEAPTLRPDVVRAWHAPDFPLPHTQWTGSLQLAPDSNVTAAYFQICRVGSACFAPPAAATDVGNHTFRFDTRDYLAGGKPVDYQAGWELGVVWLLDERLPNGTLHAQEFPVGPDLASSQCQGDAAAACAEAHYLVVWIPLVPHVKGPGPSWVAIVALLGLAAIVGRRGR